MTIEIILLIIGAVFLGLWIIPYLKKTIYFSKHAYGYLYKQCFHNKMTKGKIHIFLKTIVSYDEFGFEKSGRNKDYGNPEEVIELIKQLINDNSKRIKIMTLFSDYENYNCHFRTYLILDDKCIFSINLPNYNLHDSRELLVFWQYSSYYYNKPEYSRHFGFSIGQQKKTILEELKDLINKDGDFRNYTYEEDISHNVYHLIKHILNEHNFSDPEEFSDRHGRRKE